MTDCHCYIDQTNNHSSHQFSATFSVIYGWNYQKITELKQINLWPT